MRELSKPSRDPVAMLDSVHSAAALFPLDHHLRRLPSAMAAGMSGVIPATRVLQEIENALELDPYAVDLKAQRDELKTFLRTGK